jgi:DNA-binding response OmpR family regulator
VSLSNCTPKSKIQNPKSGDLILMDLLMPVLDGFEVTRQLRQLPELKDVVAIALSADVFESTKQKSLAAGCQDFLPKPVQAELLLESVMVHLRLEGIYEEPLHSREVEPNLCAAPVVPPPRGDRHPISIGQNGRYYRHSRPSHSAGTIG